MSIIHTIEALKRMEISLSPLKAKYHTNSLAMSELNKLETALKKFANYLNQLDRLKPNYNTNEINSYMEVFTVHFVILKEQLDKQDYAKLEHCIRIIKTMLKFHPTKYSSLAFIMSWL